MRKIMWIITYMTVWNYHDRDNYACSRNDDPDTVTGETLKEALSQLVNQNSSVDLINSYADKRYEGYTTIEILSCYRVTKEVDVNNLQFDKLPAIRNMISNRKAEIAQEKQADERRIKKNKQAKERATLKKLKAKYETSCR